MKIGEFLNKIITFKAPATLLYIFLIPFINWSYAHVPNVPLPDGGAWPPLAIITGLILVVRDFAQREIKHYIWLALIIAAILSFVTSSPIVATASTVAFVISEIADWALFTFSKRPLSERVLISSLLSAPIDTILFWYLVSQEHQGVFQPLTIATAIISKLLGAYIVYRIIKKREQKKWQN